MTTPSSSSDSSADSSTDSSAPSPTPADTPGVILTPRPWVPLGLVLLGLASLLLLPRWSGALWLAGALVLFGLLLLLQTALLRLQFSPDALLVWRRQTLLRRFPYDEWLGWAVWWSPLPVLFYFREQRSIHLLPVLFDATALREQLNLHISAPK
ncbi:DUF3119 family protein [Synechococcus sp. CS-602]|uniref:DUF3119 family protein n=1 Tax=Synechococcaceae TaxID=1890426 RepID=UPI0008FF457F|nr:MULTISPECIES: DUF3119 family protein [Synechococcaceae]MCT4365380.1 DUF3119 family protein [Candidatus Regnicoccus frigidus MAG-AL1]APD47572.1 hypothetical protein BM449_03860 [Synechococcus sp. SynAce01]MCT0202444.1 DUF3119 family protein [Synechococcus sp. CS-603]MCT0204250.1 DUF3119 family protein [Synechococcus sp. CS-602]MCT0247091.1 DUF3119 family protein [Synechococcus sp. CS-601]